MVLELDNCCFCIELRTGSLIIGYLNLFFNVVIILLVVISLVAVGAATSTANDDTVMTVGIVILILLCVLAVFVIINLIFAIVLLVGLHMHKRGHLKAYLIYTLIFIALGAIDLIAYITQVLEAGEIIICLINLVIGIGITIYFLNVIRSYWLKMDNDSRRPAIHNTA